jgi:hypothetical protein
MYRFTGDFSAPGAAVEALVAEFPGYFPFLFRPGAGDEQALVIGPGGGRDILLARMAGFGIRARRGGQSRPRRAGAPAGPTTAIFSVLATTSR